MHQQMGRFAFLAGIGIALFGAAIHWAALFMSPLWMAFLRAPPWAVDSLRNKTWVAPVGGIVIGILFLLCAIYAYAALEGKKLLPLARIALPVISIIFILRGLLVIPALLYRPTGFNVVGSMIWLVAGICFLIGTLSHWRLLTRQRSEK
jgi:hypothetical protein